MSLSLISTDHDPCSAPRRATGLFGLSRHSPDKFRSSGECGIKGNRSFVGAAGTHRADAILEMSTKGFGCVGIITDGDLRRHMRNNLLDARVHDLMTHRPKTARPDQLISETLDIRNSLKVTALFAVGAGKPVGIIHVHDLLRAGAA